MSIITTIMGKALGFLGGWKAWALGGAILLAAAGGAYAYVKGLQAERANLRAELVQARTDRDKALDAAHENERAFYAAQADAKRAEQVVMRLYESALERERALSRLRTEVANAPASDDGPVAPVLRRVLDGLQRRQGGAHSGDEGAVRAAGDPGPPARLPRQPADP